MSRGGAERKGDTESKVGPRLWAVGTEPNAGLELTDCWDQDLSRIWTLNELSHPGAPKGGGLKWLNSRYKWGNIMSSTLCSGVLSFCCFCVFWPRKREGVFFLLLDTKGRSQASSWQLKGNFSHHVVPLIWSVASADVIGDPKSSSLYTTFKSCWCHKGDSNEKNHWKYPPYLLFLCTHFAKHMTLISHLE